MILQRLWICQYFIIISQSIHFKQIQINDPETIKLFQSGGAGIKHTNLDLYEMERIKNINPDIKKSMVDIENEMVGFLAMGCDGFIGKYI
ncbi:MAG: hypothetical protein ACLS54_05545 [Anaerostipes hadrus]